MSEQSGFFDAHKVNGDWDRTYVSADFARYFSSLVGNGVFANQSSSLQVIQNYPQDMSISVSTGRSWIDGYFYDNDTPLYLSIDLADGVLDRIDIVVNRWSAVDRKITTCVKKGVPAVTPTSPVIQWDADIKELQLASILVKGGITAVTQDLITDTRMNSSVCGWVTSLIDQVDTSTLFLQWKAAYNKEYQDTQTYIAEQKALWDAFFSSVSEDIGIIDGSVTTPKLASGAVTSEKLAKDAIKLLFTNVMVKASAFTTNGTYQDYGYRAVVKLNGVISSMIPEVILGVEDASSVDFAPVAESYDGGVYLYAASKPQNNITIPTIICWRG